MHSVHIAEWILALVTTRDRAASTVGDLTEGAATRGVVWFWCGVLRTAASLLWRDVAEHPARVRESDVLIYAIGVFEPYGARNRTPEESMGPGLLSQLAEQTGGR